MKNYTYDTSTRIYILDTPFLSEEEAIEWLKKEGIRPPKEERGYGFYWYGGELGRWIGRYLLSKGWKFHVEKVKDH